jgi:adenosylcobyric acid synthase
MRIMNYRLQRSIMRAIMVVGTASNAGKSLLVTAICRWLKRRGDRVTPFKGQNMALNSYVVEGGEIGYAQAVQAWAAGIIPRVENNPILLKPQGDMTSQVILMGQVAGVTQAADYYQNYFEPGWQAIQTSLAVLAKEYDWIVCEGAGSPAEINLKHRDLTNMRVAIHLQAATILVVNIDLGGAFAHVVGTLQLLTSEEKRLIKGIVINKFRGQRSLLQSGIDWLEEYTGIPVLGVIPYLDLQLPAEDSLALLERRSRLEPAETKISVIRLPRISNFTDFDPLLAESSIDLEFLTCDRPLGNPDAVILPGSKTTIADLLYLQSSGMAAQLQAYWQNGGTIMGICGGWQMLGATISDRLGLEGKSGTYQGLGCFPMHTELTETKILRQREVTAMYPRSLEGSKIQGYEIHQGISKLDPNFGQALFSDPDLGNTNQQLWGTYLHGLFDCGTWRRTWIDTIRQKQGLTSLPTDIPNYSSQREIMFDQLADAIAEHLDLQPLLTD